MKTKLLLIAIIILPVSAHAHRWIDTATGGCFDEEADAQAYCSSLGGNWQGTGGTATCYNQSGTFELLQAGNNLSCSACPEGEVRNENGICEVPPDCEKEPGSFAGTTVTPDQFCTSVVATQTFCNTADNCQIQCNYTFQDAETGEWWTEYVNTGENCQQGQGSVGDETGGDDPDEQNDPPPELANDEDSDSDGDGSPDYNDDDIDGDGTPNSTDGDIDGDGIPNADDPSPNGAIEQETASKATHGDDCTQRPTCSGDAIQCAQLFEIYRLRCRSDAKDLLEDVPDNEGTNILNNVDQGALAELDTVQQEYEDSLDDDPGIVLDQSLFDDIADIFSGHSCADISVGIPAISGTISCADTLPMRIAFAWFLGALTVLYLYHLARKPVES